MNNYFLGPNTDNDQPYNLYFMGHLIYSTEWEDGYVCFNAETKDFYTSPIPTQKTMTNIINPSVKSTIRPTITLQK